MRLKPRDPKLLHSPHGFWILLAAIPSLHIFAEYISTSGGLTHAILGVFKGVLWIHWFRSALPQLPEMLSLYILFFDGNTTCATVKTWYTYYIYIYIIIIIYIYTYIMVIPPLLGVLQFPAEKVVWPSHNVYNPLFDQRCQFHQARAAKRWKGQSPPLTYHNSPEGNLAGKIR